MFQKICLAWSNTFESLCIQVFPSKNILKQGNKKKKQKNAIHKKVHDNHRWLQKVKSTMIQRKTKHGTKKQISQ